MPQYCFKNASGDVIDRYFRMAEVPENVTVEGESYKRDFAAERKVPGREFNAFVTRVMPKWDPRYKEHTKEGWCVVRNRQERDGPPRQDGLEWT